KFNSPNITANPAVVFDVDETALTNYEIIHASDFGYVREIWNSWVAQSTGPANKPVKRLYDYFVKKEIKIIFLTGRTEEKYEATFKNLINAGYTKFDTLVVLSKEYSKLGSAEFKSDIRKKFTEKGYNIIATVGDQYPDINGANTGLKIKIPNYLYLVE
ncbi:MAG: HAD family acid phosphatase, partial [Ignavibacteriaceae bacterium]|nr:HAD family acid phosphatase [Ignavibacteriaceae bacterium]